jgi:hypothetical protein
MLCAIGLLLAISGAAHAKDVPLPRIKPGSVSEKVDAMPQRAGTAPAPHVPAPDIKDVPFGNITPGPSACDLRLAEIAEFKPMPGVVGPGECGAAGLVRLEAITLRDKTRVPLNPPATMRCTMAEAFAHFTRDDLAPATAELGAALTGLVNYDAYECRGRNRVPGAKVSEHGKGNAIDIRAVKIATGVTADLTSPLVSKPFRERVRAAVCARFATVLGPGSDSYHNDHIHLDLMERNRAYKMCQWDVREPTVASAEVPLPPRRPGEGEKRDDRDQVSNHADR